MGQFEPFFQIYAYAMVMGAVHGIVVVAGALLATPVLIVSRRQYRIFLRGFAVFNALLLVCGTVANLLWDTFIFRIVYLSMDYVFDFIPFLPISQQWLDAPWGDQKGGIYLGMNILHLHAIWFAFAFATWIAAIYFYGKTRRMWMREDCIEQATAPYSEPAARSPQG